MRVIVFSDIHGNPYACDAVLAAVRKEGICEAVVAAGDLCLGGSDPAACIEMLAESGIQGVYGNTEEYIYDPEKVPPDDLHRDMWDRVQPVAYWVRQCLSEKQMEWLRSLSFKIRIAPSNNPHEDLLVVHANPVNNETMIYPSEAEQKKLWDEVRQPDNDPQLENVLLETDLSTIAFGHFHFTHERNWRNKNLVDVAPCSMPGIDRDPRARYTIFTWTREAWRIERRFVAYDYCREVTALEKSKMPFKEDFIGYFD